MNNDYSKRGYLLPKGCNDLIDVLKLGDKVKQQETVHPPVPTSSEPKDEFQAELERLTKSDQEWREYFAQRKP